MGRKGERPCPRACEGGSGAAGRQVALGRVIWVARLPLHHPRVGRGGGGAWEAEAETLVRWLQLGIDFPFPSPPPGRLSIWRAVAAPFLGRPRLGTCRGQAARDITPPGPSPLTEGKEGAEGIGSCLGAGLEVDLLEWGWGRGKAGV